MKKILFTFLLLGWLANLSAQNIQRIEYFIDTDPGFGLGLNVPFSGTQIATANLNIPITEGLTDGFHKFYVRAKDNNGKWSVVANQNFFKTNFQPLASNIVKLEYFIDSDPGFGLANAVSFTAGQSVTKALNIPLPSNLPLGFHKFYIRAKDASGNWTMVLSQNFFKTDLTPNIPNLVKLEYFVDADPGFGNGTNIPVSNNTTFSTNQLFTLSSSLTLGDHSLTIRSKDANGLWSVVGIKTFKNCPGLSISAPLGLVTCNDSLTLTSLKNYPEIAGTINWYRNGNLQPQTTADLVTYTSGVFKAALTTPGCSNVFSNELSVNVAGSISVRLKAPKPITYCNESQVISIDSAFSVFPVGVSPVFDWYKNDTLYLGNSPQANLIVNAPGEYKVKLTLNTFPGGCQVFESDSVIIQNQNLTIQIGPESTPGNIVLCPGSSFAFSAVSNILETPTFQWFKDGNPIADQTANTMSINNGGLYLVKGSIGACLNIASNTILATVTNQVNNEVPVLSSDKNLSQTYCYDEVITFTATGCSNGVLWTPFLTPISATQATYSVGGTYQVSVSCKGVCSGAPSNTLTVLSSGFFGTSGKVEFAMASLPNDYQRIRNSDFINTYNGARVKGRKNLVSGGYLTFGTNTEVIWENYSGGVPEVSNGYEDFFIRYNRIGGYGKYYYLGGTGLDTLNGYIETDPGKFLMYGGSNSPVSGSVSQPSFGGNDFWIVKFDIATETKVFDKKFGGTAADIAISGVELSNGQLIIGGNSSSAVGGNKSALNFGGDDYWIVKTDANGNKLADYSYGGSGTDRLSKILKINDNLFVLFGTSNSPVSGNKSILNYNNSNDYWVVWINANGVIQQQKTYGGSLDEKAVQAMISTNGELYFCGSSNSEISNDKTQSSRGLYDFWVVKTNATGQKVWDKTLGGYENDFLTAANFTLDEHPVFLGTTSSMLPSNERHMMGFDNSFGNTDAWLIEVDTAGNFVTDYILGSCGDDVGSEILELNHRGEIEAMVHVERLPQGNSCPKEYFGIGAVGLKFPIFFQLEKASFQNSKMLCKNTSLFLRLNLNAAQTYNVNYAKEIVWSNGQTVPIFKTTLTDTLDLTCKVKLLKNPCFSLPAYFSLPVFPDLVQRSASISSPFQTTINKEFAYNKVTSTQKILERHVTNYTSEKAIELNPGFEIKAGAQNIFKAEIGGCIN